MHEMETQVIDNKHKTGLRAWLPVIGLAFSTFIFNTSEFVPIGLLSDIAGDFGISESQTGLMITIADLFEAKRKRYIDPYLDYLAMLLEERKLARQNRLLDKVKLRKRFTIKIR